jgi:hypothetical protein
LKQNKNKNKQQVEIVAKNLELKKNVEFKNNKIKEKVGQNEED